jgi:hypothetical protein
MSLRTFSADNPADSMHLRRRPADISDEHKTDMTTHIPTNSGNVNGLSTGQPLMYTPHKTSRAVKKRQFFYANVYK